MHAGFSGSPGRYRQPGGRVLRGHHHRRRRLRASTSCTGCASSACACTCSRPATTSAAPGSGTATRAPASTPRASPTATPSPTELLQEWDWKEHFSGQPENLRYLQLRRRQVRPPPAHAVRLHGRVGRAATRTPTCWRARTSTTAASSRCRFLITAIGLLSAPTMPRIEGIDELRGRSRSTPTTGRTSRSSLPASGSAVIGTGATGVQVIGEIADEVGELTVFQRRPNWCAPLHNAPIDRPRSMAEIKATLRRDLRHLLPRTPGGFIHEPDRAHVLRGAAGGARWRSGRSSTASPASASGWATSATCSWTRRPTPSCHRVHRRQDPRAGPRPRRRREADPQGPRLRHPARADGDAATTRPTTSRNVHLVDLHETPIERITPDGHPDQRRRATSSTSSSTPPASTPSPARSTASTSAASAGQRLRGQVGATGRSTYLGLQVAGFPNLLMLVGPHSAATFCNIPRCIEQNVDWVTGLLRAHAATRHVRGPRRRRRPRPSGRRMSTNWPRRHALTQVDSWATGINTNVEGKTCAASCNTRAAPRSIGRAAMRWPRTGYAGMVLS